MEMYTFKRGIFFKTLLGFILILVPFFIINAFIHRSGVDIIRQQITAVMQQKVDYLASSLDAELNRIVQLQMQFNNDSDLQDLSIRSDSLRDYEKIKLINDVYSKISALASSSRYISEVFVLMPNFQKRLSSTSVLTNLNTGEYERYKDLASGTSNVKKDGQHYYLLSGYPAGTKTQYLIVVELSPSMIGTSLGERSLIVDTVSSYQFPSIEGNSFVREELGNDPTLISIAKPLSFTNWSLIVYDRQDQLLQPLRKFTVWNYMLWGLALIVIVSFSYLLIKFIHQPLRKLVQAFRMVENGNFNLNLQYRKKDEFEFLYTRFNSMVGKLKVLVHEVYEQTIYRQLAELRQLQSQINPHFLYNSLYILYRMSQDKDFQGVSHLSRHLGDYFKYITQNNHDDLITLDKEIKHASSYASIQQMRFGNRISFQWELPDDADQADSIFHRKVPRLFIQPLIENAVEHGHKHTVKEGWVRIICKDYGNYMELHVADNGIGGGAEYIAELQKKIHAGQCDTSHALINVHKRLVILFGPASGLQLQSNEYGGLTNVITIYWEGAIS